MASPRPPRLSLSAAEKFERLLTSKAEDLAKLAAAIQQVGAQHADDAAKWELWFRKPGASKRKAAAAPSPAVVVAVAEAPPKRAHRSRPSPPPASAPSPPPSVQFPPVTPRPSRKKKVASSQETDEAAVPSPPKRVRRPRHRAAAAAAAAPLPPFVSTLALDTDASSAAEPDY